MKILIACVDMVPRNTRRQPWFYMNAVAKGLMDKGHDICILTDEDSQWPDKRKTIVFKNFRSFPVGINTQIGRIIEHQDFDLVIWSTGLTDFFFRNSIGTLKIPVIAVITSPRYSLGELMALGKDLAANWEFARQFLLGPLITRKRIKKFLASPNLKAVVFQCKETSKRYIPDNIDWKDAFVVPPPLPDNFLNILKTVKAEKEDSEYFKVLYFGPPLNLRGIDTVVHAMSRVVRKTGKVKLDILSRIENDRLLKHEKRVRKLIGEKGLDDKVNFVSGMLTPEEIIKYMLAADVICLPFKCVVSDVPIAVLEALATGTPLIATEVAGVSEFASGNRCYIVPPGDGKSLSQAIMKVKSADKTPAPDGAAIKMFVNQRGSKEFALSFNNIIDKVMLNQAACGGGFM